MFELKLNQAHLLQTYFAFYCGSPRAFHQAELSHGALVVACKRMHLLRPGISAVDDYRASNNVLDPVELFRRHKEDATRAMLGWGIYVGLDPPQADLSAARLPVGRAAQYSGAFLHRRA
jgi:hypothetical protein